MSIVIGSSPPATLVSPGTEENSVHTSNLRYGLNISSEQSSPVIGCDLSASYLPCAIKSSAFCSMEFSAIRSRNFLCLKIRSSVFIFPYTSQDHVPPKGFDRPRSLDKRKAFACAYQRFLGKGFPGV